MHSSDSSAQLIDWLAISVRWLALLGSAFALFTAGDLPANAVYIWLAAGIWNILISLLVVLNRRWAPGPLLSLLVDSAVAYLIFYFGRGEVFGVAWIGVLPLFTAGLYFGWRGGVASAAASLLVQGAIGWYAYELPVAGFLLGVLAALYFPLALILGWVVRRYRLRMAAIRRTHMLERCEKERLAQERRSGLYQLISDLSATLNYERVLETALDLSGTMVGEPDSSQVPLVSIVFLFRPDDVGTPVLQIGSARRLTPADMRLTLPGRTGVLGQAIEAGEAQLGTNIARDPELGQLVAVRACQVAYCLPLRAGQDSMGVLVFAHPEAGFFSNDRRETLDIIGNQAMIAIQNARLYRDLELEKERIVEIQEDVRKKLARDLHDGPTQSVSALAMRANIARRMLEQDVNATAAELIKIEDLARHATQEIRHMLFTLRPLVLESQGLTAALASMAEKMAETYNQAVIIDADPDMELELEMSKQGVIFSIAEEAVNNARKHAQAERIWVRLKHLDKDLVYLQVEDNGRGFNIQEVAKGYEVRSSLGMVNMRERAELVNGFFHIESSVGRGTRVYVLVPLSDEAADRVRQGLKA